MPRFYTAPAAELAAGLSTADGQDVLSTRTDGDWVTATVYTPRPDDPGADDNNRAQPETRLYRHDELVELAQFEN